MKEGEKVGIHESLIIIGRSKERALNGHSKGWDSMYICDEVSEDESNTLELNRLH